MAAQLYLKIISGPAAGQSFSPGPHATLVIGRDPSCAVYIADALMSRRHVELQWDGEVATIRDLQSTNGTRLKGARLDSATLTSGDTIELGTSKIEVSIVTTPDVPAAASADSAAQATAAAGAAPQPEPADEPEPARLRVVAGPRKGTTIRLQPGESLVIGRDPAATFPIADDALSGEHLEIRWDGRTCRVRDLHSANGTYVNGARIADALLRDGDRLDAGLCRLLVALPAVTHPHPEQSTDEPATAAPLVADAPAGGAADEPPVEPPPDALELKVIGGRNAGAKFAVAPGQPCVVGRALDCAVCVDDVRMSGHHFELHWDGRRCECRDLDSSNGTSVNGTRVRVALLQHRDEIGAGASLFLVHLPAVAAAEASVDTGGAAADRAAPTPENEIRGAMFKVLRGEHSGELLAAPPTARVIVGRDDDCAIRLEDPEVSGRHAELVWVDPDWHLRDLHSANGVRLNGTRVTEAVVHDRDEIALGRTVLLVRLPQVPPPPAPEPVFPLSIFDSFADTAAPPVLVGADDPLLAQLVAALERPPGTRLYALIDGAQAAELVVMARQLGHAAFTLFSGAAAPSLAHVGPGLVALDDPRPFLLRFHAARGRNAGVLLQTTAAPEPLCRHLREIFVVTDETQQEYFFRYYDPRVLRVFLPTCTHEELRAFFGPVTQWIAEDAAAAAYTAFSIERGALRTDTIAPASSAKLPGDADPAG